MTIRFPRMRSLLPILVVLATVTSTPAFSFTLDSPRLYRIEGYLDRAPEGEAVIDRVAIAAPGERSHELLVTRYRIAGGVLLGHYLSRELISPYRVIGNQANVSRLLGAPKGAAVKGTFVVYTQAVPSLMIADLDQPA